MKLMVKWLFDMFSIELKAKQKDSTDENTLSLDKKKNNIYFLLHEHLHSHSPLIFTSFAFSFFCTPVSPLNFRNLSLSKKI